MVHWPFQSEIGESVSGSPIVMKSTAAEKYLGQQNHTLVIGGFHGDERGPVRILERLPAQFLNRGKKTAALCLIPRLNPDGFETGNRFNANGVDLNRNFPADWSSQCDTNPGPSPLSEPESRALHAFLKKYPPRIVVSLHWSLSEIDADGLQSRALAEAMWECLSEKDKRRYRVTHRDAGPGETAFYPGSLGRFCGHGLEGPNGKPFMITLEMPYTADARSTLHPLPGNHQALVQDIWRTGSEAYLRAVAPSVQAMLRTAWLWSSKPISGPVSAPGPI
jgi:hypothetical protein